MQPSLWSFGIAPEYTKILANALNLEWAMSLSGCYCLLGSALLAVAWEWTQCK